MISSGSVNEIVNAWSKSTLKSLLVPGGLLLMAVATGLHTGLLTLALPSLTFLYYCALAAGLLLAWRFHSSRVFFALIVLFLAQQAIAFFASGHAPITGSGRTALEAVAVLLPLNFVGISLMRERGFTSSGTAPVLIVLFVQSVVVGVLCLSSQGSPSMARGLSSAGTTVSFADHTRGALAVGGIAAVACIRLVRI